MTERHTHGRGELREHYTGSRLPDGGPYAERYDSDLPLSDHLYQGGGYMYPAHNYTYGLSRIQLRPAGPFPEDSAHRPGPKRVQPRQPARRIRPVPAAKPEPHTYQVAEPFIPAYEVKRRNRHTVSPYDSVANKRVAVSRNKRNDYSVATMLGDLLESQ